MSKSFSKGTCQFCQDVFSKAAMPRHLETCAQRAGAVAPGTQKATKTTRLVHLLVEGRDKPQYWMHLEVPAEVTLQTVDTFLRRTWLECCGHLSKFEIAGVSYASYPDREFGDKSMRMQVGTILSPGQQFFHEYDYGTPTELRLKAVAARRGVRPGACQKRTSADLLPGLRQTSYRGLCPVYLRGWRLAVRCVRREA